MWVVYFCKELWAFKVFTVFKVFNVFSVQVVKSVQNVLHVFNVFKMLQVLTVFNMLKVFNVMIFFKLFKLFKVFWSKDFLGFVIERINKNDMVVWGSVQWTFRSSSTLVVFIFAILVFVTFSFIYWCPQFIVWLFLPFFFWRLP